MEAEAGVLKGMEAKCKACAFVCVFSSLCVYVFMESPVWATFQIAYFYLLYLLILFITLQSMYYGMWYTYNFIITLCLDR